MKNRTLPWALAAILGSIPWAPLPLAAAGDPPVLQPPALAAPDPGRAPVADPLAVIRRDGPPSLLPEDPGPAPGPDYFYISGQHVPSGTGVAWRPGFWARTQPGWDWLPARWIRQSDGWTYREGRWTPDGSAIAAPDAPRRHVVARPAPATSPFGNDATTDVIPQADPNVPTGLAPLPDAGSTGPGTQPAPGPGPSSIPPPPPPGLPGEPLTGPVNPNPNPNPNPDPRLNSPLPPIFVPVTEINVPGVHIRIVPPMGLVGNPSALYPGVVVPPVQVRTVRPLRSVRQRVRDLIDGVLP